MFSTYNLPPFWISYKITYTFLRMSEEQCLTALLASSLVTLQSHFPALISCSSSVWKCFQNQSSKSSAMHKTNFVACCFLFKVTCSLSISSSSPKLLPPWQKLINIMSKLNSKKCSSMQLTHCPAPFTNACSLLWNHFWNHKGLFFTASPICFSFNSDHTQCSRGLGPWFTHTVSVAHIKEPHTSLKEGVSIFVQMLKQFYDEFSWNNKASGILIIYCVQSAKSLFISTKYTLIFVYSLNITKCFYQEWIFELAH